MTGGPVANSTDGSAASGDRAGYSASGCGSHGGICSRQHFGSNVAVRPRHAESGVLRRRYASFTPAAPTCLRTRFSGDSLPVPARVRRANSGRRVPFLASPSFPGRSGRRFPGRPEQKRRSGHRPAFPDKLPPGSPGSPGSLTLAASSTHSGSTASGTTHSRSTGSRSTGSGSTGSGSTGSSLTGSDPMAWGPAGSGGAGADADGSGPTDSNKVDAATRAGTDGNLSSSPRRWNTAAALAVLPYNRISFRACRCATPHSRCLSCSRRNRSASAE